MTSRSPGPESSSSSAGLPRGTVLLVTAASIVVVVAGLQAASALLIPILFSALLSFFCFPPMRKLQSWGVPAGLAIVTAVAVVSVGALAVVVLVGTSLGAFSLALPDYLGDLDPFKRRVVELLQGWGLVDSEGSAKLEEILNPKVVLLLVSEVVGAAVSVLSNLFVILLLMVFMLIEVNGIGSKVRLAFGESGAVLAEMSHIKEQISSYVSIKAWLSLVTGIAVGVFTWLAGIDFPVLWGFVAFIFNFVPNIGSIIAAVPAVLLALAQGGWQTAGIVMAGYLAINVIVGNVLEPRVLGNRLGLSTLVVFLSLIFWSWVWGWVGMLLSVPLTVVVKIVLAHIEDLRPIAVMLGPVDEESAAPR